MTVTILDDDPTTAYADHAVADEGDKARVAIRLSHPRDADAEVTWATREVEGGAEAGKDFTTVAAGTVTVPAGKTIVYVEVATLEDELIEGDESFEVAVTKVDLPDFIYGEARTVTIRDDDRHAPMFTGFEDVSVEENEDWSVDPTLEGEPRRCDDLDACGRRCGSLQDQQKERQVAPGRAELRGSRGQGRQEHL